MKKSFFSALRFCPERRVLTMQEIVREDTPVAPDSLLSKAVHAGTRAAKAGLEGYCMLDAVSQKFDAGMVQAKRLMKKGRYAAADVIDETTYRIKRDPLRAVALTFGVGMGIGMLGGWLATRNGKA
jgi:hypothetical protein